MRIVFYTRQDGANPVKSALEELERERPGEYEAILRKQRIVRELNFGECVEGEYVKPVRGKVWSLKMRGHQSRILGFRWEDAFMAAHLIIKKQNQLDERDIDIAEERREDWVERHGS